MSFVVRPVIHTARQISHYKNAPRTTPTREETFCRRHFSIRSADGPFANTPDSTINRPTQRSGKFPIQDQALS